MHSTVPANYTDSYTAEHRVITAGILRELINRWHNIHQSYLINFIFCVHLLPGYGSYYMTLIMPIMDYNITTTIPIVLVI